MRVDGAKVGSAGSEKLLHLTSETNPVEWLIGMDGFTLLAKVCFGLPNLMPKCVEMAVNRGKLRAKFSFFPSETTCGGARSSLISRIGSEGAKTSAALATLYDDGPTGGYFHLGQPLPW